MTTRDPADLERLRAALAAGRRPSEEPTGVEPDAGRIFDAVHGEMSADDRQAVVDGLWRDADAAEAWRLAASPIQRHGVPRTPDGVIAVGVVWQLAPWRGAVRGRAALDSG